jgi:hypothetical protein
MAASSTSVNELNALEKFHKPLNSASSKLMLMPDMIKKHFSIKKEQRICANIRKLLENYRKFWK